MTKRQFPAIALILSLGAAVPAMSQTNADHVGSAHPSRTQVTFGPDQTIEDLLRIKQEMAPAGVTLNYRELRFSEKNTLERIDFSVADGSGNIGTASAAEFKGNDPFGFVIDRSKGAPFSLSVGHFDHYASQR